MHFPMILRYYRKYRLNFQKNYVLGAERCNKLPIREFISPSGLMIQGTQMALLEASLLPEVRVSLDVPVAMMVSDDILELWISDPNGETIVGTSARIEGWRDVASSTVPD